MKSIGDILHREVNGTLRYFVTILGMMLCLNQWVDQSIFLSSASNNEYFGNINESIQI